MIGSFEVVTNTPRREPKLNENFSHHKVPSPPSKSFRLLKCASCLSSSEFSASMAHLKRGNKQTKTKPCFRHRVSLETGVNLTFGVSYAYKLQNRKSAEELDLKFLFLWEEEQKAWGERYTSSLLHKHHQINSKPGMREKHSPGMIRNTTFWTHEFVEGNNLSLSFELWPLPDRVLSLSYFSFYSDFVPISH